MENTTLSRRWQVNIILVIAVVVLAIIAIIANRDDDESGPRLTALSRDEIARISIIKPGEPDIVINRSGDQWRLDKPVRARGNSFVIDALLNLATAPSVKALDQKSTDPKTLGLVQPGLKVRFNDAEIRYGDKHPLQYQYYVSIDDQVHLIDGRYYDSVNRDYTYYIDNRLLESNRELTGIQVPGFQVLKKAGSWLRHPADSNIGADQINDFVDQWTHARALSIEKSSGKATRETVRLNYLENGKTQELKIGIVARSPELILYRADEGLEYHFPEMTGRRLLTLVALEPQPPANAP